MKLPHLVLAALLLAAPAFAETAADTLQLGAKVADWQLAHLVTTHVSTGVNDDASQTGWVYGALFVGLTEFADHSPDPKYTRAILEQGRRQNWGLGPRPFHADDYVIGQSWVWAYGRRHDRQLIRPLRARFDAIIKAAPKDSLDFGSNPPPGVESACQIRWCWADALFMAPPAWAVLSRATGDPKYLAYADKEFWATKDFLFDDSESLFARDSRFFTRRGEHGEKIFWSRGNGWVYAGLTRMLQLLPANYPSRPRYEALFRRMSEKIVSLQKPDGYWPVSLLGPREDTPPETSGTGFFTFGLAYGVRTHLLSEPRYREAAERGWSALKAAVQEDGKLGWVQKIGAGPDAVAAGDTQLYGVGAFLLAASAMADLRDDPPTDKIVYPRAHGQLAPPPAGQDKPAALVRYAPYRYDDILWENDRIAHRLYGPALQAVEPPSGSGIDVWGKHVRYPFMERQLADGRQHDYQGEGLDFYNVGQGRGDGGLGIWFDNKLWLSRNYQTYKILNPGPKVARFSLDYAPWPVGVVRKVWEHRELALPLGTNFTRQVSTISSDDPVPLVVGIGINRHATSDDTAATKWDAATGKLTVWEKTDPDKGTIGLALMVDPAAVVGFVQDADNFLVLLKVAPGTPFVYYSGACWDKGLDFHTRSEWEAYVAGQKPDFKP